MTYKRKTIDVWRIYANYTGQWEHECTELTREAMKENRKAYREAGVNIKIVKGRDRIEPTELS